MTRRRSALFDVLREVANREGLDDLCQSCGGLTPDSPAVLVVEHGCEPVACAECGLWLDARKRPVGVRMPDASVVVRLIVLRDGYPANAAPLPVELQTPGS